MKESWEKMGSESKLMCVGFTLSLFLETSQYCNLLLLASVIMKRPSCPHPTHATASCMIFLHTFSSAACNLALGQQLQHIVTCEDDSGSTGHSVFRSSENYATQPKDFRGELFLATTISSMLQMFSPIYHRANSVNNI